MRSTILFVLCSLASLVAAASPSFDNVKDQNIRQNDAKQSIIITGISSGDADSNSLEFFATSSNKDIVNDDDITINYLSGTSASTATLNYQPEAGASGTTKITISIYGQQNGAVLLSVGEFSVNVEKTDVDCGYSAWGQWSTCDVRCNTGKQSRSRSIIQQPMGNAERCDVNKQIETQECNTQACVPPTINQIADQSVPQDAGSFSVDLTGITAGQGETDQEVTISVESSNSNLIRFSSNDLLYQSPASSGKLWYTPNPGQSGSTNVVITVTDSGTNGNPASYTTTTSFSISVVATPVDCLYEWGSWSGCSTSCGDGTRTREARITRRANNEGQQCPSPLPRETRACFSGACPEDCKKEWGEWQSCSVSCGAGVKTRYEVILSFPQNGGEHCGTLDSQQRPCQMRSCPVDCQSEWSEWSECSASCDSGLSSRQKQVTVPASGNGERCESPLPREERACNMERCPAPNDCTVGDWTEWSICSTDCTHSRHRRIISPAKNGGTCQSLEQQEACHKENCPRATNTRDTCERKCGSTTAGSCACDTDCLRYGDCCSDYTRFCQSGSAGPESMAGGCMGRCGAQGFGDCWCDSDCERSGDCCSDYRVACGTAAYGNQPSWFAGAMPQQQFGGQFGGYPAMGQQPQYNWMG